MALACATGVSYREWLRDPVAMITAAEILEETAEHAKRRH